MFPSPADQEPEQRLCEAEGAGAPGPPRPQAQQSRHAARGRPLHPAAAGGAAGHGGLPGTGGHPKTRTSRPEPPSDVDVALGGAELDFLA